MQPFISVILPVYNGTRYLQSAIDSVLSQTYSNFEFLIYDDGSRDSSLAVLDSITDARVQVLPHSGHRGLFGALNHLIQESKGEFLQILCQDDRLEPPCLSEVVHFFQRNLEIAFLYSKQKTINAEGYAIELARLHDLPKVMKPELALQHFYYHGCIPGNLTAVAVRKEKIIERGLFREDLAVSGDYDMWVRMAAKHSMGILHEHLVCIRRHEGQLSKAKSSGLLFIQENRRIRSEILPLLPASLRKYASHFETRRHFVQDFHYAVRALLMGRFADVFAIFQHLGPTKVFGALFYWLITGNNRFQRPQGRWILPADYSVGEK